MRKQMLMLLFTSLTLVLTAQKASYSIGVLLDNRTAKLEPIITELQEQIKVVVGEDASISFPSKNILINNYSIQQAEENYNKLLENETDIILAFGVINNVVISRQSSYPKPTILFGAVNSDLIDVDLKKTTSGINNFTYLIESESYLDDLRKLKELTDFKKVGIVIEQQLINILPFKETFDKEMDSLDADYRLIPFQSIEDITSNLNDIDAVYLAGGFFLTSEEIKILAETFIEKKLPSFTAFGIEGVLNGLFASNQGEDILDQFQRRIALNVEAYVNGTNLSELSVFIKYNPRLTINYNTAELIGVPIKYSLIGNTDFVGEFKNMISEKEYNLLSAIRQGLGNNLSLAANEKDITLSEQDLALARADYLPSVSASVSGTYVDPDLAETSLGQNPEFSTAGNITAKQVVFSEAIRANIDIQRELIELQKASFNTTQLDLVFEIATSYFTTLILKTNAQIQLRNLDLTKRNLQIAEQNYEVGESGKSDVLRFRSEIAQNTQTMVEAINQLEMGFIDLNKVLNNPLDLEIDVEDAQLGAPGIFEQYNYTLITTLLDDPKLREPFIEFLVEEAERNAPELKALDYNLAAIDRSKTLYGKGRYYPTVSLQAEYNRTFNRNGAGSEAPAGFALVDDNYYVGANISIPLFNQNLNNINKQITTIQSEQLMLDKANTKLSISALVRNNVLTVVNQISNIELSKISESTAKEALELTQTSYSSGAVNIIQLIDAQNNYLNAQLNRSNAVYNFFISALQLERSIGYYFLLNSESDNEAFLQRFTALPNYKN